MLEIVKYRVKIHVDKEPGVYEFEPVSNTGKSYLCEPASGITISGRALPATTTTTISSASRSRRA